VSPPLSQWPHHHCQCTSVFAVVTMASLSLLRWCHCRDCTGIVSPLLPLHCSPYRTDLFALMLHWRHHRHYTGVVAPPSTWHVCAVALVLSPLSHWHCCPCCTGIIALIAQASLPLLCLHCAVNLQASSPLLSWHVLSHGRHGRLRCRQRQHQRNKVDDTSATRAAMPAQ
jgi:hypothetical protein